ncbi:hypothetical protein FRC07_010786 [Ceratobasidium sp. 392]|nr:hypothetical protein FRC07_010786 [Ceratobasidium sp. 392]
MFGVQFFPLKTPVNVPTDPLDVGETHEDCSLNTEAGKPTPDARLSDTEKYSVLFLGKWFHELKRVGISVTTNAAHKAVGSWGKMIGQGWRAASDAGYSMGLYKTNLVEEHLDSDRKKKVTWEEHSVRIQFISEIYNHFFGRLIPGIREATRRFMAEHQLPILGELKYGELKDVSPFYYLDELNKRAPASSLYVSHSNYATAAHEDKDFNPYTFGLWLTTSVPFFLTRVRDESVVDDPKEVSEHIKGGQFFFADFGIAIDFNQCGGIVGIVWRAKDDRHGTAQTPTLPSTGEYMGWGSSIQVAKRTANATQRVLNKGRDVRDAEAYQTRRVGSGVKRKQEEEDLRKRQAGKKPRGKNRPQEEELELDYLY